MGNKSNKRNMSRSKRSKREFKKLQRLKMQQLWSLKRARKKELEAGASAHNLEASAEGGAAATLIDFAESASNRNNHHLNELIEKQKVENDRNSILVDPLSVKLEPEIDINYHGVIKIEPVDDEISLPTTNVPVVQNEEPFEITTANDIPADKIIGNRVMDIHYFLKEITPMLNHSIDLKCRKGLVIFEESRIGLMSTIFLQCRNCSEFYLINTQPNDEIDAQFVKGSMDLVQTCLKA